MLKTIEKKEENGSNLGHFEILVDYEAHVRRVDVPKPALFQVEKKISNGAMMDFRF
jgi:hypothetical protein